MSRRDLLIFALGVIKDECYKHPNCSMCPLANSDLKKCEIMNEVPSQWCSPELFDSDEDIEPIF